MEDTSTMAKEFMASKPRAPKIAWKTQNLGIIACALHSVYRFVVVTLCGTGTKDFRVLQRLHPLDQLYSQGEQNALRFLSDKNFFAFLKIT